MNNFATMDFAVKVEGLSKAYVPQKKVLQDVSFSVRQGLFVAITGRSGSGKTTLLNILGALDLDFTGSVVVAGRDIKKLRDRELSYFRNTSIGFVFQAFHLIPHFSVMDNVLVPWSVSSRPFDRPYERAERLLEELGIRKKAQHLPSALSAGERQRVAIARALIMDPEVILADEPTGNLDPETGKEVISILKSLRDKGKTVIIVTHQPDIALGADMRLKVSGGRVEVEQ